MSHDDFESVLRGDADFVSEGFIRVDAKKALERLKSYRLAAPAHWVLEVLRAAAASHARKVVVRTDADDVEVRFNGEPFPAALMRNLLDQALRGGSSPDAARTRLLALGVAGALGLDPKFVIVTSGGVRLELHDDEVRVSQSRQAGTFVHVRKRFGWRVAAAFLGAAPEAHAIRKNARRFPTTLSLNDETLAPPAARMVDELHTHGTGVEVIATLPLGELPAISTVELDVLGVTVATRELRLPGLQCHAVIRGNDLRRNASGSDVVNEDPGLKAGLALLEKASLDFLSRQASALADGGRPAVRRRMIELLTQPGTDAEAMAVLKEAPLIPGPSGEWYSVADFERELSNGSPAYATTRRWPEGSYPRPCALLEAGSALRAVLPVGLLGDVDALMRARDRAVENLARWKFSPVESANLSGSFVERVPIAGEGVGGELGLTESSGASVRFLHQGRLLRQAEIPFLAPMRLRAVVDLERPLPEDFWERLATEELWAMVSDPVWKAAIHAVLRCSTRSQGRSQAIDLLVQLTRSGGRALKTMPPQLASAPLFECLGGAHISFEQLRTKETWWYVEAQRPNALALLSGEPVIIAGPSELTVLKALSRKRLRDATRLLDRESDIRVRMKAPPTVPVVHEKFVGTPVVEAGLSGEVAIPNEAISRLSLRLLIGGFEVEKIELAARYGLARAVVDCPALTPNADCTGVVRNQVYERVIGAVRAAERALAKAVVARTSSWSELPRAAQKYLAAFLRAELKPFSPDSLDDVQRAVSQAPLFETPNGRVCLFEVHRALQSAGTLRSVKPNTQVPPGQLFLTDVAGAPALLADILETKALDASGEVAVEAARRRFLAQPEVDVSLPAHARFVSKVTSGSVRASGGLAPGHAQSAAVEVFIERRSFAFKTMQAQFPMVVRVEADGEDPALPEPSENLCGQLAGMLRALEVRILEAALATQSDAQDDADARRVKLVALGRRPGELDGLSDALRESLETSPVFPCTDGVRRSARALEERLPVHFVTEALEGVPRSGRPAVIATEPAVVLALTRWTGKRNATRQLAGELANDGLRTMLPRVDRIAFSESALWRRSFSTTETQGEVVISNRAVTRLELFQGHRLLATLENELPPPISAAVNSTALASGTGLGSVTKNKAYARAVAAVLAEARVLAAEMAGALSAHPPDEESLPTVVRFAFWLATQRKTRTREKLPGPSLVQLPLLLAADGSPLSVAELFTWAGTKKEVQVSYCAETTMEGKRKVWRPRQGEEAIAKDAGLALLDVSDERRQKKTTCDVPVESDWRSRIVQDAMEGEVVLPRRAGDALQVDLVRNGTLIESHVAPHPMGGIARIECNALTLSADGIRVVRNRVFKDVLLAVATELERLVVRRLKEGRVDSEWQEYAVAGVKWKSGAVGPLAQVIPTLALFERIAGTPVTVGEVLAEHSMGKPIAVAAAGLRAEGHSLVLLRTPKSAELLEAMGVRTEDITRRLEHEREQQASKLARKLSSLAWNGGDTLARVAVSTPRLKGEVVLVADPEASVAVTLVKDGVAVCTLNEPTLQGIAGVLEVSELAVNAAWTQATLSWVERAEISKHLELPWRQVANALDSLSAAQRVAVAHQLLELVHAAGARAAAHLDRLAGLPASLLDLPVFPTVDGRWVSLRSLGSHVLARRTVPAMAKRLFRPDIGRELVLEATRLDAPWLDALRRVLGENTVARVDDVEAWRAELSELEPPEGSPEAIGLRVIRERTRLLRAGALGLLTPGDLDDVRLKRNGGKVAIRYDAGRAIVWLDPQAPIVARTLAEAVQRPERAWVLLTAIFGAVNRALLRVTDEHEAQLLLALAAHLGANPSELEPTAPSALAHRP